MSIKEIANPRSSRPKRSSPAASRDSSPKDQVEERRAPRRENGGRGFVRLPGYRMNLPCRIADISATGARLVFAEVNAHHLPDRIVIAFSDRTEIDAEIRWRKEKECGVRFMSFFRPLQAPSR